MRQYIFGLLALSCQQLSAATSFTQQQLAQFASQSTLSFAVAQQQPTTPMQFNAAITLHNGSKFALPAGKSDWQVYFHLIRHIDTIELHGVKVEHVQGDLHRISPTERFAGLAPAQQISLPFSSAPWMVSYSDFMPRAFITAEGLTPEIFANTNTEDFSAFVQPLISPAQLQRNFAEGEQVAVVTPSNRFKRNASLLSDDTTSDSSARIIPAPLHAELLPQRVLLTTDWQIQFDDALKPEANYLQQQLQQQGIQLRLASHDASAKQLIRLSTTPELELAAEGYQLTISEQQISLNGKDSSGTFYAIQSLLALLHNSSKGLTLPAGKITDQPRAGWRGMHYDMARNFHGKAVTLRLIDNMARYKLNKLHLHLTEDEGWRLQIPGLPELTDIGATRCFDMSEQKCLLTQLGTGPDANGSGNGYYTTADFVEILRYATARHIEVIPEIDLPGHARAAIIAMKARYNRLIAEGKTEEATQYLLSDPDDTSVYLSVQNYNDNSANVCLPSTYAFIEKVLSELQKMYQQAGIRLGTFHMGGDEVAKGSWEGSPACQQLFTQSSNNISTVADLKPYFVSRLAELTQQHKLVLAGWEDGLMYDQQNTFERKKLKNKQIIANAWDNIWEWGVADRAYRLANNGYQVVLSPATHLYFDHPHEAHPQERGYYWATRYAGIDKVFGFMPDNLYANADTTRSGTSITDLPALVGRALPELAQPENILGIQGQVWSETIRTEQQLEQMIYPRMLALAERAWHKAAWEDTGDNAGKLRDWQSFAARLSNVELARLNDAGSSFYLPPPGAQLGKAGWQFNTALPHLTIECSTDNGNSWHACNTAKLAEQSFLTRSRQGNTVSRTVKLPLTP
ncbi:family 20 glycosylhydrolase [Rheinheimera sp.]|uniref:family 20 glycosylhydrolase n=1 Tax=Rheinheimera sp. TaxID=1869214 RepID=UPI0037CAF4E6